MSVRIKNLVYKSVDAGLKTCSDALLGDMQQNGRLLRNGHSLANSKEQIIPQYELFDII